MIGLPILSGLAPTAGGVWSGRIYNPEDGKTYSATLRRTAPDTLFVEGCVLFICQKQVWRKASALAEVLRCGAALPAMTRLRELEKCR
ncbi:DUF2147 domain-containing protein [Reyranella sp.]|uniref:DUF2147 domain-containing protein n=1 Tax=Reyranella sp. TaxID=1929291 RepID=UPI003784C403